MSMETVSLEKISALCNNAISKPETDPREAPNTGGVYIIRREGDIMYVGKAKNLHRRLNSDHISAEKKNSTSTVRRKVARKYGIPHGSELRDWMSRCTFSYTEIDDSDLRSLVEALLIYKLRKDGQPLLND